MPVFGAILLNPTLDKCLMVKGWKSGASWGFPKGKVCCVALSLSHADSAVADLLHAWLPLGKVNKEEDDAPCAAREVRLPPCRSVAGLVDWTA